MSVMTWNEIRGRAYNFVAQWQEYAGKEIAETQSFWNDFFSVFGVQRRSVSSYEKSVKKIAGGTGRIDLFWPGWLIVEQKAPGRDLEKARTQAIEYAVSLKEKERPRFILTCDFHHFQLLDLEAAGNEEEETFFTLAELPDHIAKFWFIAGYSERRSYGQMDEASLAAARLMAELYDAIEVNNPASPELDLFMVRLLFCFFADDTEIFDKDIFKRYLDERTHEDGSDLGLHLHKIFSVLNQPKEQRSRVLDEQLVSFAYINGELFAAATYAPDFDSQTRTALIRAAKFNWSSINPAIFGSLFQNISDPQQRRRLGEHYTSEVNILKTIEPLFLEKWRSALHKAGTDKRKLESFCAALGGLTFLDPACGCGNFLVVAYRELRRLELEALERLHKHEKNLTLDVGGLSQITVNAFYGIEISPFAAKIAQVALWLTDHQMNLELGRAFGQYYARIPLVIAPHIACTNALRVEWNELINPTRLSYIMGNPPFVGGWLKSDEQKEETLAVFNEVKAIGRVDYVANWYKKAVGMMKQNPALTAAFVSTNSITQGSQVAPLWLPFLNDEGLKIHFAHRTFNWSNEADKNAHVHCVIIGFGLFDVPKKQLWDYDKVTDEKGHVTQVSNINPYLLAGPDIVVAPRSGPLDALTPNMIYGNKPADGGHLFFTPQEKEAFLAQEPQAAKFMRPVLGAQEFINGEERWCLWLKEALPSELKALPKVMERVTAVATFRAASVKAQTRIDAQTPALFAEDRQPDSDYLLVPSVSSSQRIYIPIGYVDKNTIASNLVFAIANATPYLFGCLASLMHMTWNKYVCGRLGSGYRYSNTIVYNNFPFPHAPSTAQVAKLNTAASSLLAIRQSYLVQGQSYADLYDPRLTPPDLLKAHHKVDQLVDGLYRSEGFATELERIEFLFAEYARRMNTLGLG
jgi:hypothetical protein